MDTHEAAFRNLKDFLLPPTDRQFPHCSTTSPNGASWTKC
jgi:hypothetical protein